MPENWSDASGYENYVGRWSRKVADEFLEWLGAPDGCSWLDLGCGTGALSERILASCAPSEVIAVDPSEQFLRRAEARLGKQRIRFRQGHAARLPVERDSVDVAVSGLVLNFIPDKAAAMLDLARCVRPGGTVAAYVWDYAGHVQFMRYFWDVAVELNPHARELDEGVRSPICRPAPLRALFETSGLRDVETRAIDIPTAFANFADYWTPFLSGVGPAPGYCASLDEGARDALRARLEEKLPTDPDGMILLAARAWGVKGKRAAGPSAA